LRDFARHSLKQHADNLRAQNDWYAAIYWYFRALDADPTLAEAYADLADLFRRQKRLDKAAICEKKREALGDADNVVSVHIG
jgi:tetratricopeptide (TPR) repeat protein